MVRVTQYRAVLFEDKIRHALPILDKDYHGRPLIWLGVEMTGMEHVSHDDRTR